jgi:hypothetical protein
MAKKTVEFKGVRDMIDAKLDELKSLRQTADVKDRILKLKKMQVTARALCNSMTIEADEG